MELSQLKYFYTAGKYQHITKAAEELHVAQPALTQSIHRLEDELGVELFVRVGRRIELSKYGKYLMERLTPVISTLDSLKEDMADLKRKESNIIRLHVNEASALVAHAITEFQRKHPETIFMVSRTESPESYNSCDIIVDERYFYAPPSGSQSCYFKEHILLAVSKQSKFASYDAVNLADFENESFAALSLPSSFRSHCDAICASLNFRPRIAFDCEDPAMEMHLVGRGLCVAFYAEFSFSQAKHSDIALIPINDPKFNMEVVVTNRLPREDGSLINDFYSFLSDYLRNFERISC